MEAKKIEVVKKWFEFKSIWDIQVFLNFDNFYWQFIQVFNKITVLLTLMFKKIRLSNELASSGSRSASSKNNNNKPVFEKNNDNNKVNEFEICNYGVEHTKKSRKSKSQKSSKSQKLSKLRKSKSEKLTTSKKPSKNENSPNFSAKEAGSSFLTFGAKKAFNRLWFAFIKALILRHFDLECHI